VSDPKASGAGTGAGDSAAGPIPLAATVLLLRDRLRDRVLRDRENELEVFMVERHHRIDFATGALVFPGGKVDPADSDARLRTRCEGLADLDDDRFSLHVAAIRETFEESGVLLARGRGEPDLVGADRLAGIESRHRNALCDGRTPLFDVIEQEDLVLAGDLLTPYAHWVTPDKLMPKRFDTHFFLAAAPHDQLALHDGGEAVDSVWTSVDAALQAEARGERTIIFPTLANLRRLGRSHSVADAIEAARQQPVVKVLPWLEKNEDGEATLNIPRDAGYDMTEILLSSMGF